MRADSDVDYTTGGVHYRAPLVVLWELSEREHAAVIAGQRASTILVHSYNHQPRTGGHLSEHKIS